jgi:hypothetical protein
MVIPAVATPIIIPPIAELVPNQMVIVFSSTATVEQRAADSDSIGDMVEQNISDWIPSVTSGRCEIGRTATSPAVAASQLDYYVVALKRTRL